MNIPNPITAEEIYSYVFDDSKRNSHITRDYFFYGIKYIYHLDPKIVSGTKMQDWWTIEKPKISQETKEHLISLLNS